MELRGVDCEAGHKMQCLDFVNFQLKKTAELFDHAVNFNKCSGAWIQFKKVVTNAHHTILLLCQKCPKGPSTPVQITACHLYLNSLYAFKILCP